MAPHRLAGLARRGRDGDRAGGVAGVRRPRLRLVERRAARRGGRTRSTPRASSRRAGWRRAGRCRRTRRPRRGPATVGAAVEVGHDPAHHVVARGRDRDALASPGRGRPRAAPRRRSGSAPGRRAACRGRPRASPVSRSRRRIAAATASRGASSSTKRSPSASCSVAPSPRTASVTRKPSRPVMPTTAVGWNWTNSRSASVGAGGAGEQQARSRRSPGGLVVRDHSAAAPPVARITARALERAAVVEPRRPRRGRRREQRVDARAPSSTSMRGVARRRRPRAGAGSGGRSRCRPRARRGGRCARPPGRARRRRGGRRRSGRRAPRGRGSARAPRAHSTSAARAADEAAPGGERVLEMQRRASRRPRARRRARPAPSRTRSRPAAGRRRASPARPRGRRQRGEQAGGAGADHDEVRARGVHGTAYGTGVPTRSGCATTPGSRTTCPGHPERPARILALEAEMDRHGWFGWRARRGAARRRASSWSACTRAPRRRRSRRCRARGGGAIDMDTAVVAGTWEAALRAAGGAVALVDALLGGTRRAASRALRPPGHHAERGAGDGLLLLQQRRGRRRATRAPCTALERVLILDWDVHHGNGTNDIFHADPSRPVRLDPRVAAVSGHRAGVRRRARAPGEGYTVNLPVPAGSGDELYGSLVEHVVAPLVARCEPRPRARLGGLRRPPRRSARRLPGHRGGLRGDDGVAAARVRRAWARRSGSCSRAGTRCEALARLDGRADAGARRGAAAGGGRAGRAPARARRPSNGSRPGGRALSSARRGGRRRPGRRDAVERGARPRPAGRSWPEKTTQ